MVSVVVDGTVARRRRLKPSDIIAVKSKGAHMSRSDAGDHVPGSMKAAYDAVVQLTDEYAALCRKLTATLSRKRPSPLIRGDAKSWACGVVYALGRVNFLFDRTQMPHVSQGELVRLFAVGSSTASSRGRFIFKLLDMVAFDPRWSLPSKLGDNPLAWFVEVNGLIVDARDLPRPLQEEVHRLIPYVPK
jgi:hypothetical protein